MEPNQNQQPPVVNEAAQPVAPGEKRSLGPVIGIVVVVILLVLGALYVWGGRLDNEAAPATTDAAAPADDVSAIESDLEAAGSLDIDLSGLDSAQ